MKTKIFSVAALAAVFVLPACAAETAPDAGLPSEEGEAGDGKADELSSDNFTFYSARPDYRKCMYPMCGGTWVKRVNRSTTKCRDGSWAEECYVADLEWKKVGLSPDDESLADADARSGRVVLRGTIGSKKINGSQWGVFNVSEGWRAATENAPTGTFYRAESSGIQCITFPCPVLEASKLNSTLGAKTYAGVDLTPSGATQDQLDEGWKALSGSGLIVAATLEKVTGPAGSMNGLSASQFYSKIVPTKPNPCFATGCSGQICADQDMMSTCEWKPAYACYKQVGKCEPQANGSCGWTQTPELKACLANP